VIFDNYDREITESTSICQTLKVISSYSSAN